MDYKAAKTKLLNDLPKHDNAPDDVILEIYNDLKEKAIILSKELPVKPMKLEFHWFRFGFDFYIGLLNEDPKTSIYNMEWTPVDDFTGNLLSHETTKGIKWPIQDSKGEWFVPEIKTYEKVPPPSGSTPTDQYIDSLIQWNDLKKLKALEPYKFIVEKNYERTYAQWERATHDFRY